MPGGVNQAVACLRRARPSAALIPRVGQPRLAHVPAAVTDVRGRTDVTKHHQTAPSAARLA